MNTMPTSIEKTRPSWGDLKWVAVTAFALVSAVAGGAWHIAEDHSKLNDAVSAVGELRQKEQAREKDAEKGARWQQHVDDRLDRVDEKLDEIRQAVHR